MSSYSRNTGSELPSVSGVAITGVPIGSAISVNGTDPFYPIEYGTVTEPDLAVETVDWCLAN